MGKAAKAHRAKVAKRNVNLKQKERKIQKAWQDAFEEQMTMMREKFATMSGETMSGLTGLFEDGKEEELQEESESTESVSE
jgi:hypothetical protein